MKNLVTMVLAWIISLCVTHAQETKDYILAGTILAHDGQSLANLELHVHMA